MRILFLTQVLPHPLDAGPKVRAYYVLRHLAQAGHDITLLSFARDADPPESVDHLQTFCRDVITVPMRRSRARDAYHLLRSLIDRTPFLIARDWVPKMAAAVESAISNSHFDIIHADQLWMAPYAQRFNVPTFQRSNVCLILDQHNAVFQIPRRLAAGARNPLLRAILAREARQLARYEAHIIRQFDHVVWVTAEDRQAVERFNVRTFQRFNVSIIPICIDPDERPLLRRSAAPRRVTFLGGMHWPPNAEGVRWFAREVWPQVQREVPNAVLTIIGKNPPKEIRNPQSAICNLDITGYLPDPTPHLAETAVFIVPLHAGGGMRVKILDAWAWGLPIVSTTIGAEGLQAKHDENILLADDPAAFAQAVIQVLQNPSLAARLAARGRHTVETFYNWRTVYRAWDEIYRG